MIKCQNCRFAEAEKNGQLYCHRAPPNATIEPGVGMHFLFPAVGNGSWCGEFRLSLKRLFKGHGS